MWLRKIVRAVVAAALLACPGVSVFAAGALYAAKELGLQDATPRDVDFDRAFESPLPALVADNKGKRLVYLANCRDYLAARSTIVGSDTDANYRVVRLQTVPCAALALLSSARPAPRTALPVDFLRYTATKSYPATLWPAVSDDERRRVSRPSATLRTASGKARFSAVAGKTLELESSAFGMHLTLLARGDFDHDGWEDAALLWEAYAIQGSYTDARLVVLTRSGVDRKLREIGLDGLLTVR